MAIFYYTRGVLFLQMKGRSELEGFTNTKSPLTMYQKVKLPSKKHHLYRIPLRLLASVYKLYHMTTSAVPFVYGAGVFKDLVHGVS